MQGQSALSPDEVLRQARIAHGNRLASLAQANTIVDKHSRRSRASLVRIQFDKDRSPFSFIDASAIAAGCSGPDGDNRLNDVLQAMYGDDPSLHLYDATALTAAAAAAGKQIQLLGSRDNSSLGSTIGTTPLSHGASSSAGGAEHGGRERWVTPDPDADTSGHAGASAAAAEEAGQTPPTAPRIAPALAWGEHSGIGMKFVTGRWSPDPSAVDPEEALYKARATAASGSALSALLPVPPPPTTASPPWFRSHRASAPSGAPLQSPRSFGGSGGSFTATGDGAADGAAAPLFRSPLGSGGGAASHSSPLPQLASPRPAPPAPQELLEPLPGQPPSPQQQPMAPSAPLSPTPLSPTPQPPQPPPKAPSHGSPLAPCPAPPAPQRPASMPQCRYGNQSAPQLTVLLPSIGAPSQLGPPSPASPAGRANLGSPSGPSPCTGTGAWRLANASHREHDRESGRGVTAPVLTPSSPKPPAAAFTAAVQPSGPSVTGSDNGGGGGGGTRSFGRMGSAWGGWGAAPDDSLTVMRSSAAFSSRRRGVPSSPSGRFTHAPLLRPASRAAPGSPTGPGSPVGSRAPSLARMPTLSEAQQQGQPPQEPPQQLQQQKPFSTELVQGLAALSERPASVAHGARGYARSGEEGSHEEEVPTERVGGDQAAARGLVSVASVRASARVSCPSSVGISISAMAIAPAAAASTAGDQDGEDAGGGGDGLALSSPLPSSLSAVSGVSGAGCLFQSGSVGRRRHVSETSGGPRQPRSQAASPLVSPLPSLHMGAALDGAPLALGAGHA